MAVRAIVLFSVLAGAVSASFAVFAAYDKSVRFNLGISISCLLALNTTVNCDQRTADMVTLGVDMNYWYNDNITTLCTPQCKTSLQSWEASVETACAGQTITQGGVVTQAKVVPLQYTYGYDLACLQDSANNYCLLESQTWQGSDYIRYDPDFCWQDNPPAICNDPDFSIAQIDTNMTYVSNLYAQNFYCQECFLKVWRQKLLTPFLVPGNWTDYRMDQFSSMQANCATSMPYTTSASTLFVGTQTSTAAMTTATGNVTASGTVPVITPTCTGQIIHPVATPLSCNQISDLYSVATGDVRVATNDFYCEVDTPACLPPPCLLSAITTFGQSCNSIIANISTSTNNVTMAQFYGWNQNIQGSCDDLSIDQRVCIGPPGGTWKSNSTINAPPSGTAAYHTTAQPPTPTHNGTIPGCGLYYSVVAGDNCNLVALNYGITFAILKQLNPYLNDACTNLWLGYSVCVAPVTPPSVSTNGLCGPSNDYATCPGSSFGDCCNAAGQCGNGTAFCATATCQSGKCAATSFGATTNGTCGPAVGGLTCTNPSFGSCCSIYGFCGNGTDFCGAGKCYSGTCDTDVGGPSINGECGPLFAGNKTCTGTQFGSCCSVNGYCGDTADYCGKNNCYSGACSSS